jgi:hypothetical protein
LNSWSNGAPDGGRRGPGGAGIARRKTHSQPRHSPLWFCDRQPDAA